MEHKRKTSQSSKATHDIDPLHFVEQGNIDNELSSDDDWSIDNFQQKKKRKKLELRDNQEDPPKTKFDNKCTTAHKMYGPDSVNIYLNNLDKYLENLDDVSEKDILEDGELSDSDHNLPEYDDSFPEIDLTENDLTETGSDAKHQLEGNKVNEDSSLNFDKDDHTEKELEHIKLNTEIKYQEILILKQSLKQKNKEVNELKNSMISLRRSNKKLKQKNCKLEKKINDFSNYPSIRKLSTAASENIALKDQIKVLEEKCKRNSDEVFKKLVGYIVSEKVCIFEHLNTDEGIKCLKYQKEAFIMRNENLRISLMEELEKNHSLMNMNKSLTDEINHVRKIGKKEKK